MNPVCSCHGSPKKGIVVHTMECQDLVHCGCGVEFYCPIRVEELRAVREERQKAERAKRALVFAARVKEAREKLGIKPFELAGHVGAYGSEICKIEEYGAADPAYGVAGRVAAFLGIEVSS